MPLKGEAKRLYQRGYMKEYMRSRRAVKTLPVKTPTDVKTLLRPVLGPENKGKRLAEAKSVLESVVRPKTDAPQSKSGPVKEEVRHIIPYKPGVRYRPGTELVLPSGEIITTPELDAEGNPIW